MNKLLTTASLAAVLTLSSMTVFADDDYDDDDGYRYQHSNFRDTAKVTHVEPLYRTVRVSTPQRECSSRPQRQTHYRDRESYTGTIAGGIIGGVLGNQVGGGNGKKIMTVAGALLGGSIGRDMSNKSRPSYSTTQYVEECRIVERYHQEQRIDGYQVTYRYQGKSYTTHMDYRPGKRIPVDVSVHPANDNYYY